MDMNTFNVSATLNIFRLIARPTLCLPHATISTFDQLPIPLNQAFGKTTNGRDADIRAVVLDKDNCFAYPNKNEVHKPYEVGFIVPGISDLIYLLYLLCLVVGCLYSSLWGLLDYLLGELLQSEEEYFNPPSLSVLSTYTYLYHSTTTILTASSPTSSSSAPRTPATGS